AHQITHRPEGVDFSDGEPDVPTRLALEQDLDVGKRVPRFQRTGFHFGSQFDGGIAKLLPKDLLHFMQDRWTIHDVCGKKCACVLCTIESHCSNWMSGMK